MFTLQVRGETGGHMSYKQHQTGKQERDPRNEVVRPSLKSLQSGVKAKFITVYTNGEKNIHDKPVQISFKLKTFPKLDSLLDEIARAKERINKTLVRYLFKWPSGEQVFDVKSIQEDDETHVYICSDKKKLFKHGRYNDIDYGSRTLSSGLISNKSTAKSLPKVTPPAAVRGNVPKSGGAGAPVTITVISNTVRNSKQFYFFDPRSHLPFEEILRSITDMVVMDDAPCTALYSTKRPFTKVGISLLKLFC